MSATRPAGTTGRKGSVRGGVWLLAVLVLLGGLVQACSNQSGTTSGPRNPAATTGHSDTALDLRVQVAVNPGSIQLGRRAGITVLATNTNGRPLEGRHVQLSTTVGTLDVVDGLTDIGGKFVSALRVTASDAANANNATSATITAFVEGAVGTAVVNFQGEPVASQIVLSVVPGSVNCGGTATVTAQVNGLDGRGVGGVTVTFATTFGTLSASQATTNSSGQATVTFTATAASIAECASTSTTNTRTVSITATTGNLAAATTTVTVVRQ
jgi:hypothetical protein